MRDQTSRMSSCFPNADAVGSDNIGNTNASDWDLGSSDTKLFIGPLLVQLPCRAERLFRFFRVEHSGPIARKISGQLRPVAEVSTPPSSGPE